MHKVFETPAVKTLPTGGRRSTPVNLMLRVWELGATGRQGGAERAGSGEGREGGARGAQQLWRAEATSECPDSLKVKK